MIKLVFPDPLVWQAGVEFGLQALAGLPSGEWVCEIPDHGPMLEAAAFALHQLGIQDRMKFCSRRNCLPGRNQVALFPRVAMLDHSLLLGSLKHGQIVVTSDPAVDFECDNLFLFRRRDWRTMRDILLHVMEQKHQVVEYSK